MTSLRDEAITHMARTVATHGLGVVDLDGGSVVESDIDLAAAALDALLLFLTEHTEEVGHLTAGGLVAALRGTTEGP